MSLSYRKINLTNEKIGFNTEEIKKKKRIEITQGVEQNVIGSFFSLIF